jgi:hypothetical protein
LRCRWLRTRAVGGARRGVAFGLCRRRHVA